MEIKSKERKVDQNLKEKKQIMKKMKGKQVRK